MKQWTIVAAAALFGTTIAWAADATNPNNVGQPSESASSTTPRGERAASPQAYWDMHAKTGSMNREDAMRYVGPDGRKLDFGKLDADQDGKISQAEWQAYHLAAVGGDSTGTGSTAPGKSGMQSGDPASGTGSGNR